MDILSSFFNKRVYRVFSLESPQRGDSNEYTQYTISQYKKGKFILNYPKSAAICPNFQGTQERVQNSRGKRAISVRAIEVLLYLGTVPCLFSSFKGVPMASVGLKR